MNIFKKLDGALDIGLVVLRLGIGASMLMLHGYGKMSGGTAAWYKLGGNMEVLGVDFLPVAWGFMAAFAESVCAVMIMLGVFFRPAALILAFTMLVAVLKHLSLPMYSAASGWGGASHALDLLIVYVGLFLIGPGRYVVTIKN